MLSINIATQPIKMQFKSQNATLDQSITRAQLIDQSEGATLEIHQPNGELEIDQTPCRYAYGIKDMPTLVREYAQAGMNSAITGIGRIAEEGERLGSIESGQNAVAAIAADSTVSAPVEITFAYVPLPNIRYTPHAPQISVKDGKVNGHYQPGSVQGDFRPSQINIMVGQYPSITMWTSENKVDMTV